MNDTSGPGCGACLGTGLFVLFMLALLVAAPHIFVLFLVGLFFIALVESYAHSKK